MKNIFMAIKNWVKNNKWWTTLIILVIIVISFIIFGSKKIAATDFVTVSRRNISEEVSATGNVVPLSNLDLSFETSGQVASVNVSAGDKVYQGEILASLSNADLAAAVEQAKAGLKIAQAKLAEMQSGTQPEQLAVAKNTLDNSITNAYTTCDDAIRNDVDQMFQNPRTPSAEIEIPVNDFQLKNSIDNQRYAIETILDNWNSSSTVSETFALNSIDTIRTFLDQIALTLSSLSAGPNILQATIDQYKSAVSAARSEADAARSNITSAEANYDLELAGNTPESIIGQEATVEQAQANVDAAEANFSKSIIISPIDGVITNVDAKVGQTMQQGVVAISVISYGQYDVEAYIPEADISKIQVGDVATTTLDAYGSDTFFPTSVSKIDPGETVIENVPTYKVTLIFASSSDNRIRSGMTANLDILTAQKNNVLAVPSRSIYSIDIQRYVNLINTKDMATSTPVQVQTGIRGVDGYVEIISGVKEGDEIVASPNI